jgi:hypothetical protein
MLLLPDVSLPSRSSSSLDYPSEVVPFPIAWFILRGSSSSFFVAGRLWHLAETPSGDVASSPQAIHLLSSGPGAGSVSGPVISSVFDCLWCVWGRRLGLLSQICCFLEWWTVHLSGSVDLGLSHGDSTFFYSVYVVPLSGFFGCSGFDVCS